MKKYSRPNKEITAEYKIKRSRFIVHLATAQTLMEAKHYIKEKSVEHKNANHNCWAYIIGKKADIFHSSDAGEPSGSAGKPMLNALFKAEMTNTVVVVTRYFGGVKLGIKGLIDAYHNSVLETIKLAELIPVTESKEYRICTGYDFAEQLKYKLHKFNIHSINIDYGIEVRLSFSADEDTIEEIETMIKNLIDSGKITPCEQDE